MGDVQFIAPTPRRKMTRQRAAKIFLRENGRCYLCSCKLRIGVDKYQIEHPDPLCLGGSDDDAALRVVCDDCHKPKTKADAKARAERDRIITAAYQVAEPLPKRKMGGPTFRKSAPQHRATSPLAQKFEGDIRASRFLTPESKDARD